MKQIKKKLWLLLSFCMMFMFAVPVMAKGVSGEKEIKTLAERLSNSSSDPYYLTEVLPQPNTVLTKGERLYIKFFARDTWKNYFTKPLIAIFDSNGEIVASDYDENIVSLSGQDTYEGYMVWDTSVAAPGVYEVFITNAPCYANGELVDGWVDFDTTVIKTGFTLTEPAPVHEHSYGVWKTVKAATVFTSGKKQCSCSCGKKKTQSIPKLKPTIKLSSTKKTIRRNRSYVLKITKLAKGDSVKSVKSRKTSVAVVKKVRKDQYKIVGKKKGTSIITVVLKSGKKATCRITVK